MHCPHCGDWCPKVDGWSSCAKDNWSEKAGAEAFALSEQRRLTPTEFVDQGYEVADEPLVPVEAKKKAKK